MGRTITPAPGSRKSKLSGTILIASSGTTQTATIPSWDVSRADLRLLGYRVTSGSGLAASDHCTLAHTNATTITAQRLSNASGLAVEVSWELTLWH